MYRLDIGGKGLLYAAEIEEGCDLVAGYTERFSFQDNDIKGFEVCQCHDKSINVFLKLEFGEMLSGTEVLLTERELNLMLSALKKDKYGSNDKP